MFCNLPSVVQCVKMVLKPDQERVKKMIKETLTLLCKNGLAFDLHFSIEALIGVTLDDKDVFLVNINELVKSDKVPEADGSSEEQSVGASGEEASEVSYVVTQLLWSHYCPCCVILRYVT